MNKEENKMVNLSELKLKGEGKAEENTEEEVDMFEKEMSNASESREFKKDTIDYGGGEKQNDPMDSLADELVGAVEASESPIEIGTQDDNHLDDDAIFTTKEESHPLNESTETEDLTLKESKKSGFDPNAVQNAKEDSSVEGGATFSKSTEPYMRIRKPDNKSYNPNPDGGQIKPNPDMNADSPYGLYEVTGFMVEYEVKKGDKRSIQVRDHFNDIDTAFASVLGEKYLLPMPDGGYKISTIVNGNPVICLNDRQLYIYKDQSKWINS